MLNTLIELYGEHDALAIVKMIGGLEYTVPKTPNDEMLGCLGDLAYRFCNHFGGERIYVPKDGHYRNMVAKKHEQMICDIKKDLADGHGFTKTIQKHAKLNNYTEKWTKHIFKTAKTPAMTHNQMDFDF